LRLSGSQIREFERSWKMGWYGDWKPYVPVAKRRAAAAKYALKLAKKENRKLIPVKIEGRTIAQSFWGKAWCDNLESYSDFENRLPRGRTYARNGSVIDLVIERGKVRAIVSGSEIYRVTISITTLAKSAWKSIKRDCSNSIDSLMDLLQGRFQQGVMQRLSRRDGGLFPQPREIEMNCSCPDWADMCKHVAAVLYGIGARLDTAPELLFSLRDVDHLDLITQAVAAKNLERALPGKEDQALAGSDLGELFGIELENGKQAAKRSRRANKSNVASADSDAAEARPKPAVVTLASKAAPTKGGKPRAGSKSRSRERVLGVTRRRLAAKADGRKAR
jgi:uncharacterized Zn finger protein